MNKNTLMFFTLFFIALILNNSTGFRTGDDLIVSLTYFIYGILSPFAVNFIWKIMD